MKSPMSVRNFAAPVAAPLVTVGRTIEHAGRLRLRNIVGSGMIGLVWNSSPPRGGELRSGNTNGIFRISQSRCIACLVTPGLKVHCLSGTNTEDDAQNVRISYSLSKRRVKAGPALLDGSKVKTRSVGDRLDVVVRSQVVVSFGNCRMLAHVQTWNCWIECVAEVRILAATAIARPPACINCKLHQVGQPADLLRPGRFAAWQRAKLVQVDCIRAFGRQKSIDEDLMGQLIFGVVVDILRHVCIEDRESSSVDRISASPWNFAVLDSTEFVVLLPEVGLKYLRCS